MKKDLRYWLVALGELHNPTIRITHEKATLEDALQKTFGDISPRMLAVDLGTRIDLVRRDMSQIHDAVRDVFQNDRGVYRWLFEEHRLMKIGPWGSPGDQGFLRLFRTVLDRKMAEKPVEELLREDGVGAGAVKIRDAKALLQSLGEATLHQTGYQQFLKLARPRGCVVSPERFTRLINEVKAELKESRGQAKTVPLGSVGQLIIAAVQNRRPQLLQAAVAQLRETGGTPSIEDLVSLLTVIKDLVEHVDELELKVKHSRETMREKVDDHLDQLGAVLTSLREKLDAYMSDESRDQAFRLSLQRKRLEEG